LRETSAGPRERGFTATTNGCLKVGVSVAGKVKSDTVKTPARVSVIIDA
jgi:hypothetical protein